MSQPQPSSWSSPDESFPLVDLIDESAWNTPSDLGIAQGHMSAQTCLHLGNQAYTNYLSHVDPKSLKQAIAHYRQALNLDPELPEVHVKLGAALWAQGGLSLETALAYCQTALSLDPNCAEAYLTRGQLQRQAGFYKEATDSFKFAVKKAPGPYKGRSHMALAALLCIRASKGVESFPARVGHLTAGFKHWALSAYYLPEDPETYKVLLSELKSDLTVLGVSGSARFLKTVGLSDTASLIYRWGSRQQPEEPLFMHLLGDYHYARADYQKAKTFYLQALRHDTDSSLLNQKLGQVYVRQQEPDEAIIYFENALESAVDPDVCRFNLAQLYLEVEDYPKSKLQYEFLIRRSPENPYLYSNLGYVLFRMKNFEAAINAYKQAVELGRDPVWTGTVAQTLGTLYYQTQNNLEEAEKMLQMAWSLDGENLESLTLLGDIYTEQGRFEDALRIYNHLATVEPDNIDCRNYQGYLLWQLDRHDEAISAYQQSLHLNGHNPIAYNNLGVIYLDEKCMLDHALKAFETAVVQKPDYTLARFNLARVLHVQGQTAMAARAYTAALESNKLNEELSDDEIQGRLEQLFSV